MVDVNLKCFHSSVVVLVFMVFLVRMTTGLSSSKRHPYEFVKPLASDSDASQGPSPYSYGNPGAVVSPSPLINSNRRPALSLSDLGSYQKIQRSIPLDSSSSHHSSNTLFENVPLPPIDGDKDNKLKLKDVNEDIKQSKLLNENTEIPEDQITRLPIVGDITKDNKRRIVIPLRYRNKRRRINTKSENPEDNENKDDDIDNIVTNTDDFPYPLFNEEESSESQQDSSIQISVSDLPDEIRTTTTQRPTIITSSTRIADKAPAFVLNLKDTFDNMENEEAQIKTTLHNIDTNDTIRDPLALPLSADDLKNWGNNNFFAEDVKESEDIKGDKNDDNSYPPQFADTNVLFADGDIYSRLQKHKQVFTSRRNGPKQPSSYHKVQSREIPRTSPASSLQDMEHSGSSPRNATKHPKAQPYRRYKSGGDEDYYYYDYDYDNNGDYTEDDYYYRDYDGRISNTQPNSVRRNSKPTKKPKYKLIRKKPSNLTPSNSRYPSSSVTNHRYATSDSTTNRRHPSTTSHRQQYTSQNSNTRFQNHRLSSHRPTQSSNGLNDYNSKAKMTSSDKYVAYGYTPYARLPSSHLVKKSNKRQGVLSNNYQSHQGNFHRPSKAQSSSAVPYNNPRRPASSLNRNRILTPAGAGVAVGNGLRGPSISSSTRR